MKILLSLQLISPEIIGGFHSFAALSLNLGKGNSEAVAADNGEFFLVAYISGIAAVFYAVKLAAVYFQSSSSDLCNSAGP